MAKKKEEIRGILEHFSAIDFDYDVISSEYNVSKKWLKTWWVKYAEEFFGKKVALMHRPFEGDDDMRQPSELDKILSNLTNPREEEESLPRTAVTTYSDHEITGARAVLSHDLTVTEANARVAVKAANLKLSAMERLEDLLDHLPAEQVLKTIEVLDKIDDEPKDHITKKANSFMQLVQKQIIINRSKENSND